MPAPRSTPATTAVSVALGVVLRELRRERNVSQEALGLAAGSSRTYVSEIERAVKVPTLTTVFRLAEVLGVPASRIVELVEDEMTRHLG